ncbi:hypothetical protein HHI36_006661 [Cryptolaemus montrouzieri]|uniref:Cytochrome P450 n=1 Tax=Cryptolaemus montrouzieri TaxID=559131 RepID=A0ABD2NXU5_9CUCU
MIHWVVHAFLFISLLLYLIHKYISRNFDYWEKRNIPFLKPKPFVGNFLEVIIRKCDIGHHFASLYNLSNEPYFGMFIISKPILVVRDPEILKHILVKDFDVFIDRNLLTPKHEPATSHMLFSEKGEEWRTMRSRVSPFFTSNKLRTMFTHIDNIALSMQDYISKNCHQKSLEAKEVCCKYSTDVIAKCAFAINSNSFINENGEFRNISRKIFDFRYITSIRMLSYFFIHSIAKVFRMKLFDPTIITFLRSVFWESIRIREENHKEGNDLLDIIVELRANEEFRRTMNFEGDKVIAQAFIFFVAGFETTASTISFTLYELCLNSKIQKKLKENIRETLRKHDNKLTYNAVAEMDYLDSVVKETLRKYPALPFLDRVCNDNYKIPGTETILEKGVLVVVPMVGLHHDPAFYSEPEKYIPERFEEPRRDLSFLPFGKGPRACIGERLGILATKLAIIRILCEFQLEKNEDTPVPLVFEPRSLLLASTIGLPMKFKRSESLFSN